MRLFRGPTGTRTHLRFASSGSPGLRLFDAPCRIPLLMTSTAGREEGRSATNERAA